MWNHGREFRNLYDPWLYYQRLARLKELKKKTIKMFTQEETSSHQERAILLFSPHPFDVVSQMLCHQIYKFFVSPPNFRSSSLISNFRIIHQPSPFDCDIIVR